MKFPRQVRVIKSPNIWGHSFRVGEVVTATAPSKGHSVAGIDAKCERGYSQLLTTDDYEELQSVAPAEQATSARVRYLYSVVDASGDIWLSTQDREYAREIKAAMGGKKEGIIIMAYAPLKEIR